MKKMVMLAMAGLMISGLTIGAAVIKGSAQNAVDQGEDKVVYSGMKEGITLEGHIDDAGMLLAPEGIESYLQDMDFLTSEEKARLIQDEKEMEPIYQKIEDLQMEIKKKEEAVLKKHELLIAEYESVMAENEEIWKKLMNEENSEEPTKDTRSIIRESQVLTEGEKQILLDQEDRLDQIDRDLHVVYEEVERETEGLSNQIQDLYDQAEEIF